MITTDITGLSGFTGDLPLDAARAALQKIRDDKCGFLSLPCGTNEQALAEITDAAEEIRARSDVFVVIGIGGSYLGARAAIDFIRSPAFNSLHGAGVPEIHFAGNNASGEYLEQLIAIIGSRDFSVNYISKSGGTIEPSIAFRIFRKLLEAKYGADGARQRIWVTTDPESGKLRAASRTHGYRAFSIPPSVGGRFSVLSAVGLLPMAVAGCDIRAVLSGAASEAGGDAENAVTYAAARHALYSAGKKIELLACFEPAFRSLGEWWKQLFGESEGKDGRGLFPAYCEYTADLHSLGQYVQDGERHLFETFVTFEQARSRLVIPGGPDFGDGLDHLGGTAVSSVNAAAVSAVKKAHIDGGVPAVEIRLPCIDAESFGGLVYFFEVACAVSATMLGVNPFDQPGVEAYKKNLTGLLAT